MQIWLKAKTTICICYINRAVPPKNPTLWPLRSLTIWRAANNTIYFIGLFFWNCGVFWHSFELLKRIHHTVTEPPSTARSSLGLTWWRLNWYADMDKENSILLGCQMMNIYCFLHSHFFFSLNSQFCVIHCRNPSHRKRRIFFLYILWLEKPWIAIFRQNDPEDDLKREFLSYAFSHSMIQRYSWAVGECSSARPPKAKCGKPCPKPCCLRAVRTWWLSKIE